MTEGIGESFFGLLRVISKGLEGHSASLDKNLSELRKHMMNSSEFIDDELILDIEQDIRILHLERQENNQDFLDIGASWQRSLNKPTLPSEQKQQLLNVESEFRDAHSNLYQIPAKFRILLNIQLAADKIASAGGDSNSNFTIPMKKIADGMILLLEQITPSKKLSTLYKKLIKDLELGLEIETLPSVIDEITKFIESALAVRGDDFSNYLQGLNKQLCEVQDFIQKTQGIESESAKVRAVADGKVRESISNIREVVQDTTEIEELQQLLSVQLNHIIGAMDALQNEEYNRDSSLLSNYTALKQRVSVMEKEADKVQDYIEEERKQARLDALTRLPNRTAYNEIMAFQIENFNRYEQPLSLVICDLDHFKIVNDTYGHLAGDKVLSLVSKILCKGTRSSDFVTRYGGEEFAIIVPSTKAEQAAKAMDKIRRLICKSPFNYHGDPISISMSFGVCEARPGDSIDSLFSRADTALYKAKANGRNAVYIG
ncbi:MAG: GGDEF domain-containing protein [Oceanospirillaceae bacterium]